ncbi:phytanoyl-CoA dioxygenase family protein [Phragmitibacter flavus]|uniref:Phytanoyl-CoA dioxygenase family protein n=1 Tax=Phragmitibacter flavus TaxID=2576071 RepID=A0A5R8K9I4_9BACT|nr:phytanoyl-CoA dioxygenase family protein [Phragmitibacter flavus]TLD68968.1 phytanoyl-CoA dioxygenase family protein [Phragmitibacter flavus]
MQHSIDQHGFTITKDVVDSNAVADLLQTLGPVSGAGRRALLSHPQISAFAHSSTILALVRPYLPEPPIPVRAIYFDKTPETNWGVTWHQDLTLALKEPIETPGFGPWSIKDGIPHVQPPAFLLTQMLTLRLHLDEADESNGALKVLPGSHQSGRLSSAEIQDVRTKLIETLCSARAGDALLMRPLLLHSSSRSISDKHRRILHIEYAGFHLPNGLSWHQAA